LTIKLYRSSGKDSSGRRPEIYSYRAIGAYSCERLISYVGKRIQARSRVLYEGMGSLYLAGGEVGHSRIIYVVHVVGGIIGAVGVVGGAGILAAQGEVFLGSGRGIANQVAAQKAIASPTPSLKRMR
jgi:hypothetical protein